MASEIEELIFSNIMMPWETFKDKAEREARERETGVRWTDDFIRETEEKVREYESLRNSDDFVDRVCATSCLKDVYKALPYHLRHVIFEKGAP